MSENPESRGYTLPVVRELRRFGGLVLNAVIPAGPPEPKIAKAHIEFYTTPTPEVTNGEQRTTD